MINGTDIVDVMIGEKGPRSDSNLFEETQAELPGNLEFIGDKAYTGRTNTTMYALVIGCVCGLV